MSIVLLYYSIGVLILFLISMVISGGSEFYDLNIITTSMYNEVYNYGMIVVVAVSGCFCGEKLGTLGYIEPKPNHLTFVQYVKKIDNNIAVMFLVLIYLIMLALLLFEYGDSLIGRYYYHIYETQVSESEGYAGLLGSVVSAITLYMGVIPGVVRYLEMPRINTHKFISVSMVLMIVSIVVLYGYSTRFVAIVPIFYMLATFFKYASDEKKFFTLTNLLLLILSLSTLVLVIEQREVGFYGVSSIMIVFDFVSKSPLKMLDNNLFSLLGSNIIFVSENYLLQDNKLNLMLIELSPLSGIQSGWYDIYDLRRFSFAIPYNGIGTLAGFSLISLFLYCVVCGYISKKFDIMLYRILGRVSIIVFYSFCIYFAGLFLTYNLRSATRLLYYALYIESFYYMYLYVYKSEK